FLVLLGGAGVLALTQTKAEDLAIGLGVIGGLAVLVLLGAGYGVWRVRSEVLLYDAGLIEKCGGRKGVCRWEEMEAIAGMVATTSTHGNRFWVGGPLVLTLRDGTTLTLSDGLADSVQLGEFVTTKVLACLLPLAREAVRRGETVVVGPLRLDRF